MSELSGDLIRDGSEIAARLIRAFTGDDNDHALDAEIADILAGLGTPRGTLAAAVIQDLAVRAAMT